MRKRHAPYTGEPCPHYPRRFKTEAAHQAHNRHNREYWERQKAKKPQQQFESDAYPLRLRLQRLLANIKFRCTSPTRETYAGRGIRCLLTFEQLEFLWKRDHADCLTRASIDRIENDGDYELTNVRFIEFADNVRRGVAVRESKRHAPESTKSEVTP